MDMGVKAWMSDVSTHPAPLSLLPGGSVAPGGARVSPPVPGHCWVASPAALGAAPGAGRCLGKVCGAPRALLGAGRDTRRDSGLSPRRLWKARSYCRTHWQQSSRALGRTGGGSGGGEALMAAELISPWAAAKVGSQSWHKPPPPPPPRFSYKNAVKPQFKPVFLLCVWAADIPTAHPTEPSPAFCVGTWALWMLELTPFVRTLHRVLQEGSHSSGTQKGSVLLALTASAAAQMPWNQLWALDSPQSTLCSPVGDPQPALTPAGWRAPCSSLSSLGEALRVSPSLHAHLRPESPRAEGSDSPGTWAGTFPSPLLSVCGYRQCSCA